MRQIINFQVTPQIKVIDYEPIEGYEFNPMPCFWDLIQMPVLDAIQYWILSNTKLVALSKFRKTIAPMRETTEYKQVQIDLEDIVKLTDRLVCEYQRSNGRLPTLMYIGHKQWSQIQRLGFMVPYDLYASPTTYNNSRSPDNRYRGMRVVLSNSINGVVLLGDEELEGR